MRNLVAALVGLVAGAAVIVTVSVAAPHKTTVTVQQGPAGSGMGMNGMGGSMMTPAVAPSARMLTIQHVQRGCHVWSNGTTTAASMQLRLKVGQRLRILDQDVDAHRLVQFAGPAHLRLGGVMMMNHGVTLAFPRKGVYKLGTKTVDMPGGMMDVETIGPDNKLRLVVTVA